MTKVFMVSQGWYSDYHIVGIYSTRELADRAAVLFEGSDECVVKEVELDHLPEAPLGMLPYRVTMRRDGDVISVCRESADAAHIPNVYVSDPAWTSTAREGHPMYAEMWATDEAHAVKIAGEWRSRMIALDLYNYGGPSLVPGKDF